MCEFSVDTRRIVCDIFVISNANPTEDTQMTNLKFFYNGIKVDGGKLQKASYSTGPYHTLLDGTITIYAREYRGFSVEIAEAFDIENGTDTQTDYFEKDRIRVLPTHPLYSAVSAAAAKRAARYAA